MEKLNVLHCGHVDDDREDSESETIAAMMGAPREQPKQKSITVNDDYEIESMLIPNDTKNESRNPN